MEACVVPAAIATYCNVGERGMMPHISHIGNYRCFPLSYLGHYETSAETSTGHSQIYSLRTTSH